MYRFLGAALVLGMLSCSHDDRWEKTRAGYCEELEILSHDVQSQLDEATASARDPRFCEYVDKNLRIIGARIRGFMALPHVLAQARPESQTVEQAGFVVRLDDDALQRYDTAECRAGNTAKAAEQVVGLKTEIAASFEEGLKRCRAIGWQSTLKEPPSK